MSLRFLIVLTYKFDWLLILFRWVYLNLFLTVCLSLISNGDHDLDWLDIDNYELIVIEWLKV